MTTYSEIIDLLKEEEVVNEFYRFQGANSFEYYNRVVRKPLKRG